MKLLLLPRELQLLQQLFRLSLYEELRQIYKLIYILFLMVIKVNNKCIGCGTCSSVCPEVFEMKGSKAVVKAQKKLPCVKEAIDSCPVDAISDK